MNALINGISLSYEDKGSGPAVLLIHGFPLTRAMWQPQIEALSAAGFRIIAPDLRGSGSSDATAGPYSMSLFADDIIALMDMLQLEQASICGMSMGGYVLFNILERHPERVRSAIFMVTRCTSDTPQVRSERLALLDAVWQQGPAALAGRSATVLFAPENLGTNKELLHTVSNWLSAVAPQGMAGTIQALLDRKDYSCALATFTQPALIIGAEQDQAVTPGELRAIAAGLPNSELHMISGAGHLVNLERPEACNICLLDFLNKVHKDGP